MNPNMTHDHRAPDPYSGGQPLALVGETRCRRRAGNRALTRGSLLVALALGLIVPTGAQRRRSIEVQISGQRVAFDRSRPFHVGRRLLVPMRKVFEHMGASVSYDRRRQRVTAVRGVHRVELVVGRRVSTVNGKRRLMDVAAHVFNGRVHVPLRFLAENLDAGVAYLPNRRLVRINPH